MRKPFINNDRSKAIIKFAATFIRANSSWLSSNSNSSVYKRLIRSNATFREYSKIHNSLFFCRAGKNYTKISVVASAPKPRLHYLYGIYYVIKKNYSSNLTKIRYFDTTSIPR